MLGELRWQEREADEVIRLVTPPSIMRSVVGRILEGPKREGSEGTPEEIRRLERRPAICVLSAKRF